LIEEHGMYSGSKKVKTFWAAKPGQSSTVEVILEGQCGDKCGYVRSVESGERWMTYGYTTLAPADEVNMTFQLSR